MLPSFVVTVITVVIAECEVYICDFHREQSWIRWAALSKHGVSSVRDELLALLRRIARATTVDGYEQCVQQLQAHDLWKSSKALQQWFGNTWLHERKVIIT